MMVIVVPPFGKEAFDQTQIFRVLKSFSVRETIRNLISLRLNLPRSIFPRVSRANTTCSYFTVFGYSRSIDNFFTRGCSNDDDDNINSN